MVNAFVKDLLADDPNADVVVLGDINDFEFSRHRRSSRAAGRCATLVNPLPPIERYSYVYQGNAQVLDQILISPAMRTADYDIVHINAEFNDQISDHDPQVLRFVPRAD